MTPDKYWFVCQREGDKLCLTDNTNSLEEAKQKATEYALNDNTDYEYLVLEAKYHFKSSVSVIITDLSEKNQAPTENPTTDKTNTVEPKFKVGDKVIFRNKIHTVCSQKGKTVLVLHNGYYDIVESKYLTLAEPTPTETPKHEFREFKVGDKIKYFGNKTAGQYGKIHRIDDGNIFITLDDYCGVYKVMRHHLYHAE